MAVYITGSGSISPQPTWEDRLENTVSYPGHRLRCVEPDYSPWIPPAQQRRMSRIIKMGVASALIALKEAGVALPNGIITGTGFGCLQDTGQFLAQMINQQETALNPTPFIQSTHNTIGSQIALLLQVRGYNQTYTQDGLSFENALVDSFLQLNENPDQSLLVGGIDELTDYSHSILQRFDKYRSPIMDSLSLFQSPGKGTLAGEGTAWFTLTGNPEKATACIEAVTSFYKPDEERMPQNVAEFLSRAGLSPGDIDLLLLGKAGDAAYDACLDQVAAGFTTSSTAVFKHLCGEFPVASAFGLWLANYVIRSKRIPGIILSGDRNRTPQRILIYNRYFGADHSLILLKAC